MAFHYFNQNWIAKHRVGKYAQFKQEIFVIYLSKAICNDSYILRYIQLHWYVQGYGNGFFNKKFATNFIIFEQMLRFPFDLMVFVWQYENGASLMNAILC